jgi:hypothetical protein
VPPSTASEEVGTPESSSDVPLPAHEGPFTPEASIQARSVQPKPALFASRVHWRDEGESEQSLEEDYFEYTPPPSPTPTPSSMPMPSEQSAEQRRQSSQQVFRRLSRDLLEHNTQASPVRHSNNLWRGSQEKDAPSDSTYSFSLIDYCSTILIIFQIRRFRFRIRLRVIRV